MRSAGRIRPWSTTPGSPSARSGLLFYPGATESSQSTGRPVAGPSHFRSIISSGMSDIAIGHSSPEQARVVSRCLTDHRTYVYASRAYLSEAAPIAAREDLKPLIGFVDELLFPREVRFSDAIGAEPRIRSTNVLAQLHATLSGSGLCRAACFHRIQQPDARSGAAGPSVVYALLSPAHLRRS
jgi:hypothetical protein